MHPRMHPLPELAPEVSADKPQATCLHQLPTGPASGGGTFGGTGPATTGQPRPCRTDYATPTRGSTVVVPCDSTFAAPAFVRHISEW